MKNLMLQYFLKLKKWTSSYDDGFHETMFVSVGSDAYLLVYAAKKHTMSVLNSIRMQISNFDNVFEEFLVPKEMMHYSFFSHFVYALKKAFVLFIVPFSTYLLHTSILLFSEALSKFEKSGNNFRLGQNKDEVGGKAAQLNFGGRQATFAFGQLHSRIEASDTVGTSRHRGSKTFTSWNICKDKY
ncbi:MAG: hypothetical protein EZS28_032551 [Streblomastix strix]|uniref:Uncharacterized protein n=1 Tax=Streblomastix strix TaxID=222440 RepID=A0A5J4UPJ8_9EUKA|nr:MAG: hypothetical protein EZS28_032551 [Streblomastix strix]